MRKSIVFLLALLLNAAAFPLMAETHGLTFVSKDIVKSPNDKRSYEYLVLDNQMRVLLVSDPEADKSAAALTVGVGSLSNPPGRDGLAHFLEHMLFLGTKKYPNVDEYGAYIKRNGGSHNAFTASNQTTYFFDIKAEKLEPALDRFAQFFIAPLFNEKYVDREKHAVHSEYQLKLKEDSRRIDAAQKQSYNPASPYARFAVGSLDTLNDRPRHKIRDDLIAFYNKYYSSNIMGLTIVGREPLATLREWAINKFSAVPNHNASRYRPKPSEKIYLPGQLPREIDIVPLKNLHKLIYSFPMPSAKKHFRTRPFTYLAHFIGHEGKGSIYAALRDKGWISSLNASGMSLDDIQGGFEVEIELTPEGLGHTGEITQALFDYIDLLQQQGISEWRYDELKRKSELDFRFKEKTTASHYATRLSARLLDYPPPEVLRGGKVMQEFNAKLIADFVRFLRPDNVAITLVDQGVKTDHIEPLYKVPYRIAKPSAKLLPKSAENPASLTLALPYANPFIPERAALKPMKLGHTVPILLEHGEGPSLWFRQDETFGVPKAIFSVHLEIPKAMDSVRHVLELSLLRDLVEDQLDEFTYPAQLAGLGYSITRTREGLNITLYGYDEKQPVLLDKVLFVLRRPTLDPERFAIFKEKLQRDLQNLALERPYRQILNERNRLLIEPSWSPRQKLDALQDITRNDVADYAATLFDEAEVRVLSHGNVTAKDARGMEEILRKNLLDHTRFISTPEPKVKKLAAGKTERKRYAVDHPDSVVLLSYQGQDESILQQAYWRLLGQVISSPFYTELRTNQQLGYAVFAAFSETRTLPGALFLVQSSAVSAKELEKRMQTFISSFPEQLKAMSDEEFASHKAGLINKLLKKDDTLFSRSERYLDDLERNWTGFDFREQVAAQVDKLTRKDLLAFYARYIQNNARLLVVYSPGTRFPEKPNAEN